MNNNGTFIYTFDNIIIDSSYNLYKYIISNSRFYYKYLNIYKLETKENLDKRKERNIIQYLLNNNLSNIEISNLIYSIIINYYNKDIYNNMELTYFAKSTLLNPIIQNNKNIEKIIILVKYHTNKEKEYKQKLINKYFNNNKYNIIYLKNKENYIDYIKNINYNVLITDEMDLIKKICEGNIERKEFILPDYGYCQADNRLKFLIREKGGNLTYFNRNN